MRPKVYSLTGVNFCSAAFSKYWMTGLSSSILLWWSKVGASST